MAWPRTGVSAVKYKGKLYYVFPTATKDKIYVGRQKQFDSYKNALAASASWSFRGPTRSTADESRAD